MKFLYALGLLACAQAGATGNGFEKSSRLDKFYDIFWRVDEAANEITLAFEFESQETSPWLGFGLSPSGGMAGADIMLVTLGETAQITDRKAAGFFKPALDEKTESDWKLVSQSNVGGTWSVEVTRKLDTGDTQGDVPFTEGSNRIIYAIGSHVDGNPSQHSATDRGTNAINFYGPDVPPPPTGTGFSSFDVTLEYTQVQPKATEYICQTFELPFTDERHGTYFEPIIDKPWTHHIILYSCDGSGVQAGAAAPCGAMKAACSDLLYGWAVGGPPLVLPENAGVRMGGGQKFVLMEVHYDNPALIQLQSQVSVRIYNTVQLRAQDVGFLRLGVPAGSISIPAGQSSYGMSSDCVIPADFPEDAATVFASGLHMHEVGKEVFTNVYRDGKLVTKFGENLNWDFNVQEIKSLPPFKVGGGDVMRTYCVYDTTGRTTVTKGGDETTDEMCINYLMYYPKTNKVPKSCSTKSTVPDLIIDYTGIVVPEKGKVSSAYQNLAPTAARGVFFALICIVFNAM